MKGKSKGINDDTKIGTIPDLLARVNEEYLKRQKEALVKQKANKERLAAALQEEQKITATIAESQRIVEAMEADFSELETKAKTETKKQVEKGIAREADVRAGRITLKEFNQRGKYDEQIAQEIIEQSTAKLEMALKAIRAKNLEILKLEAAHGECQNIIRGLIVQPGQFMQELLKGLKEFTEHEVGLFIEDMQGYRTALQETKRKLFLCEGKSLSSGQNWERITAQEAKKIAFDPVLPISLIPKLRSELLRFKDDEAVTVYYYFRDNDVEVRSCAIEPGRRGIITTSKPLKKTVGTSKLFSVMGGKKNG